jgi:hypothetical protein
MTVKQDSKDRTAAIGLLEQDRAGHRRIRHNAAITHMAKKMVHRQNVEGKNAYGKKTSKDKTLKDKTPNGTKRRL